MKVIDIINLMSEGKKLPKKIKYFDKEFKRYHGGYYSIIGENFFNFISEKTLNIEIKIVK